LVTASHPSNKDKMDHIRSNATRTIMPCQSWKTVHTSKGYSFPYQTFEVNIWGTWHETPAFIDILNRTFNPPGSNPYRVRLLQALKSHTGSNTTLRTQIEHIDGWRKARKTMASSMSNVYFRHYMAGTFNPDIAIMNTTMANIPLISGYAPKRWRKGLNVMLKKQVGNLSMEKTTDYHLI